jgi:hypothetical protein
MVIRQLVCTVIFLTYSCNAVGNKLYIFLPTEYTAIDVEKKFSGKYDTFVIRSFSSVTDFTSAVFSDTPDAIITKPQLVPLLDIYQIKLNATLNGSTKEPYFILSVEKPLTPAELSTKEVGILDFLGKKNINTLMEDLLDGTPRLKRVKKMADLVPLMTMNLVDGVIVSATQVAYIKSKSQLKFYETRCKTDQGIAVLALFNDSDEIVKKLKELPAELAIMIGVDGWK